MGASRRGCRRGARDLIGTFAAEVTVDEIKVYADMRMRTIAAAFLPPWLEVMALRRDVEVMALRRDVDHLTKRLAHERERANAAEAALEDMIEAGAFEPSPGVTIHIAGDVIGDLVIGS